MQLKSTSLLLAVSAFLAAPAGLVAAGGPNTPVFNPNVRDGAGIGIAARIVTFAVHKAGVSQNKSLGTGAFVTLLGIAGTSSSLNPQEIALKALSAIVTFAGTTYFFPVEKNETEQAKKEEEAKKRENAPVNLPSDRRLRHPGDYRA